MIRKLIATALLALVAGPLVSLQQLGAFEDSLAASLPPGSALVEAGDLVRLEPLLCVAGL